MKTKVSSFFNKLKPQQKGVVVMMGLGVVLTVVGVLAYISSSSKYTAQKAPQTKSEVVSMDNRLLERSTLLDAQKEAQVAKDALKQADEKKKQEAMGVLPPPAGTALPMPVPQQATATGNRKPTSQSLPPVPQQGGFPVAPPPPVPVAAKSGGVPAQPQLMIESEIGGISLVNGVEHKVDKDSDKKKDEKRSVYLPISYMEATLLSGLDAPTSSDAKGNPVPVLIRVKTPAVLPNDVKANLKGCFVVADGKGNLGTERAELVLVSLSCLDRKGQAVIDQPVTGYVVDADGKAGLRGRVVTKMGALIARSMVAGIFGGVGDALKSASTTSSLSALGSVSQIKPEDLAAAGLGSGISNAFKEVQKFYLELAHQTLPVIEIGAARPITLVVTKGAQLEIKKIRGGNR